MLQLGYLGLNYLRFHFSLISSTAGALAGRRQQQVGVMADSSSSNHLLLPLTSILS
jgi:hypothetical protein